MTFEITIAVQVFMMTLIISYYNQRQAAALRGMERLAEDFIAMQVRDRRAKHLEGLAGQLDPLEWLAREAGAGLDAPLVLVEVLRVVQEVQAVEVRAESGQRLIVSPFPRSDLQRYDRRVRFHLAAKGAAARLASFSTRPLLGASPWGCRVMERVLSESNEFFDLEAEAVAERLGLKWNRPSRLWFYVVRR